MKLARRLPVFLVPMPCRLYLGMVLAQLYGIVGLAFQCEAVVSCQIHAGENLSADTEEEMVIAESHVLARARQRQAVFAQCFNVHSLLILGLYRI